MSYIVKFNTTLEWVISDEDIANYPEVAMPEDFIKYQNDILKPSVNRGTQSLEDFVGGALVRSGNWVVETEDGVEDKGEYK
jgi:hypothetical protein